jgi:hypothetical protein
MRAGETMILPAVSSREVDGWDDEPRVLDSPPLYPLVPQTTPPRRWLIAAISAGLTAAAAIVLTVGAFLAMRTPPTPQAKGTLSSNRHLILPTTLPTSQPIIPQTAPASRPAVPLVVQAPEPPPVPPAPPPRAGAVIVDAIKAEWDGLAPAFRQDIGVDPRRLESGLVKLVYESGVEVVVEGPAEITAEGPQRLTLSRGRVTTRVPHDAAGFTLRTPTAQVIDLGTEFGASVEPGRETDVHVLVGAVSVAAQQPSQATTASSASTAPVAPTIVKAGAAVSVATNSSSVQQRKIEPLAFVNVEEFDARSELAGPKPSPAARWIAHSYAVRRDPTLLGYYLFDRDAESVKNLAPAGIKLSGSPVGWFFDANSKPIKPTLAEGRLPERVAASFDGSGRHIVLAGSRDRLNFYRSPKDGSTETPFTVSFWVKVEPNRSSDYPAFISKGRARHEQFAFDVRDDKIRFWVRDKGSNWAEAAVYGDAPRDSKWQHLVGVYDPHNARVELFVDGKLCGTNRAPRVLLDSASDDVLIGARTGADIKGNQEKPFGLALSGSIDEIAIFSAAKTAEEVKALYEGGRP